MSTKFARTSQQDKLFEGTIAMLATTHDHTLVSNVPNVCVRLAMMHVTNEEGRNLKN